MKQQGLADGREARLEIAPDGYDLEGDIAPPPRWRRRAKRRRESDGDGEE